VSGRRTSFGPVRTLALALAAIASTGCHSWRPVSAAPHDVIDQERPAHVRATLDDGRVLTLAQPTVVADTLFGNTGAGLERVPTAHVRALEVERGSVPKTLALIVTHVSVVLSVIAIIIDVQPHYRGF